MIFTEILADGRKHTYSDAYKIRQIETGIVYDDAVDSVEHTYEETDIPLDISEEATTEDYEAALAELGVT